MSRAFSLVIEIIFIPSLLVAGERSDAPAAAQKKPATQILLKLQVLELSQAELARLGFSFNSFGKAADKVLTTKPADCSKYETFRIEVSDEGRAKLFQALCQQGAAKVLAEPTLATVSGRPASYFVGGEVKSPVKPGEAADKSSYRRFGTEVNFVPIAIDDVWMQLELRARVAQLDPALDVVVEGNRFPGIRAVEIDTGLRLEFGKTAIIAGLVQRRAIPSDKKPADPKERKYDLVETVFLVTPERVTALAPAALPQPGATR